MAAAEAQQKDAWKKLPKLRDELETDKFSKIPADSKVFFSREENEKLKKQFWSAPFDARFPQQNQTNHCWFYYVDYHRCRNLKGEDYEPCEYLKEVYRCSCPASWTNKWDGWMEEGRFPVRTDR